MFLREPCLPPGWYPRRKGEIEEFLEPFAKNPPSASAALAPHAGWFYSGIPAALAVSHLDRAAETAVVIGGHLSRGMPVLAAEEDAVKTPLGRMEIDSGLRDAFNARVPSRPDRYRDNTVEVLLPMVHYFFPEAKLLWLRFPAELASFEAGRALAEAAAGLGRRVAVLASSDLTHYGENYGFCPRGKGKPALEWMKKVNDAAFISAVLEGGASSVLERAEEDCSACSAGAVLGALGFSAALGKGSPRTTETRRLLDYRSSADADAGSAGRGGEGGIPDSFVGYAAVLLG